MRPSALSRNVDSPARVVARGKHGYPGFAVVLRVFPVLGSRPAGLHPESPTGSYHGPNRYRTGRGYCTSDHGPLKTTCHRLRKRWDENTPSIKGPHIAESSESSPNPRRILQVLAESSPNPRSPPNPRRILAESSPNPSGVLRILAELRVVPVSALSDLQV